nr:MAG TPA: hypothetical protein [Caudoviricetes sp.]
MRIFTHYILTIRKYAYILLIGWFNNLKKL